MKALRRDASALPIRTIAAGTVGSVLMMLSALGAGGILISDPVIGAGPLSWIRYGHGKGLAMWVLYIGFALVVIAWVRLGRYVLRGKVGARPVLIAAGCWLAPLLISPPLFTRDVFVYLAQGALLYDLDPYVNAPNMVDGIPTVVQNVYPAWQTTPSPYGPLFLALSKGVVSVTGDNVIPGVILMRLALLPGLLALIWALTRLVKHLGGQLPVTLWLAVASPMMVVHLWGGPHNELLMLAFLACGVLAALERKHALAVVLITLGMLTKPTAAIALPFIVWIWANHMPSERGRAANFVRAVLPALAVFGAVFTVGTWAALGSFNIGWFSALEGPQLIKNWLNFPTGIGQLLHGITDLFIPVTQSPFITGARGVAWLVLAGVAAWQWWLAREGGTTAVKHMAITLLAVAMLAPPTLPWYLTWALIVAAGFAWQVKHLAIVVGVSVFLVLAFYPTGEQALNNPWFMLPVFAVSILAWRSLTHPDPLGVVAALRPPEREPAPKPAEQPADLTPTSRSSA
jgi:alpha-1,6-mannosyltransferase